MTRVPLNPRAVLLAAGSSERFGGEKLLHPLVDRTPMVALSARALRIALGSVLVVVRDLDSTVAGCLRGEPGVQLAGCAASAEGMGRSIACAVRESAQAAGWLIALGDMPFIRVDTLRVLARGLTQGASIVVPVHRGQRGHPVGFSSRFREDLMALRGDRGARSLLAIYRDSVTRVPVDDAGIIRDIDVPDDLV